MEAASLRGEHPALVHATGLTLKRDGFTPSFQKFKSTSDLNELKIRFVQSFLLTLELVFKQYVSFFLMYFFCGLTITP